MQKATNTVKMYFPLMPDCYKRYYLEGGHDSICMEEHMIGTETVFITSLDHGKREDRKDMRLPGVVENLDPPIFSYTTFTTPTTYTLIRRFLYGFTS